MGDDDFAFAWSETDDDRGAEKGAGRGRRHRAAGDQLVPHRPPHPHPCPRPLRIPHHSPHPPHFCPRSCLVLPHWHGHHSRIPPVVFAQGVRGCACDPRGIPCVWCCCVPGVCSVVVPEPPCAPQVLRYSQGPLPCPGRVYVGALWVDADQAGLPTGWKGGFCRPEERSSGELPAQQLRVGRPVFRRRAPDGARLAVGGCMGCLFLRMHGPDGLGPPRHLLRQLACPLHGPAVVFHSHFCPRLGLDCAGHLWRGPPLVPPLLPHRLPQRDLLLVL